MKRYLFGLVALLIPAILFGQKKKERDTSQVINQTNRLEIEISEEDYDFTVIPGEDNGLMLVTETSGRAPDGLVWNLHGIDTALNIKWKNKLVTPFGSYFKGHEYFDENYYLLFATSEYRREDLIMWKINAETHDTTKYFINTVFPIDLKYFEIVGNTAILGGYAFYKPVIMLYDMVKGKPKVLPGVYNNFSEILDIVPNDEMRLFSVIMSERMPNKLSTVTIKSFTADGTLIQNRNLRPGDDKSLLDGASTTFLSGYQYVAGTYSRKKSEFSRGLYLSRLKNGVQEFIKYHNYGDLNNFFSYMSEKREERIKNRIEKRKSLGKKIRFNYRLMVHDIIERENEYILVGEAYYPRYRSTTNTYGRSNGFAATGFPMPNTFNPYFIGYRYTHAIVVGFSKSGDILWDNSFEIKDVQTQVLREFVNVTVDEEDDKIVLLYLYDNTIRSKIIQGNEIIEGITFNPVKLSHESDEAQSTNKELEGLEKWYDNKLFGYGFQKIKNLKDKNVKISRRIFYINKIEYEKGLRFQ